MDREQKPFKTTPETWGTSTAPTREPYAATSNADIVDQAKEAVSNVASRTSDKVVSRLDEGKNRAAEGLTAMVNVLRDTGQKFSEQNPPALAQDCLNSTTDQIERFANYVRSTNVKQMVGQVEDFARRQPAIFFGAAFALGLLTARFLRSSGQNAGYRGRTWERGLQPPPNNPDIPDLQPWSGNYPSSGSSSYRGGD
jgi:hypothetical protein